MAAFTAKDVQALREKTNVGMMDCKKALVEADGDMDKAVEILREKGLATAAKKASRIAAEGVIGLYTDGTASALIELNCETDFVGNGPEFKALANQIAKTVVLSKPADLDALLATTIADGTLSVADSIQELFLSLRENLKLRRFALVEGTAVSYIHAGGSVGVLVSFDTNAADKDEFVAMGKNIAMQVAAMNPEYLSQADISADELAKMKSITIDSSLNKPETLPKPILRKLFEKAVNEKLFSDEDIAAYEEQKNNNFLFNFLSKEAVATLASLAVAGKEEFVADKIFAGAVEGRIKKQLKEICLLDQAFVRSDLFDGTVAGYVADVAKKLGAEIKVTGFVRLAKGEGIEKKEDNFAAEVASMM
ncbi:MAG: elongation factor Ts [Clostridia bacterium]|nr:elongation factor Ts [Clostridia bacterium]